MRSPVRLPEDFTEYLSIDNAANRFDEAMTVAKKMHGAGIPLFPNLDHVAIFCDPPHLVAGPLKRIGYVNGWDACCYPSPVDGCDYINVSAQLPAESPAQHRGWFGYVAVVHPVDQAALDMMLSHGYGNPFLHHVTWGIVPPDRGDDDDFKYAARVIPFMVETRNRMADVIGGDPGTLIAALPPTVMDHPDFDGAMHEWMGDIPDNQHQVETMQGGGF